MQVFYINKGFFQTENFTNMKMLGLYREYVVVSIHCCI